MADNKSEKASQQRMRKARADGQFMVSRGALSAVQFVLGVVFLSRLVRSLETNLTTSMTELFQKAMSHEITADEWPALLRSGLLAGGIPVLEFSGILLGATAAAHLAMTRFGFSLTRLTPQVNRLSPLAKLRSMPAQNLRSLVEAVLLLAALAASSNSLVAEHAARMLRLALEPVPFAATEIADAVMALLWKAAALFIVFGAVDLFRQQRKYTADLRMTKQEVREENRRTEGDPQMKGRIRRLRRDLLRKQMMRDVATATAIVVNPTHYAVAIRYEIDSTPSPMVVAKGKNWLALRIRRIAVENHIPIIENPPLARALYDAVEVGRAISPEFYKAIAEILAYVYRVMGRRVAG